MTFIELPGTDDNYLRTADENLYDADSAHFQQSVGLWTERSSGNLGALVREPGEAGPASRGKFTVVALSGDDGAWRFHVDGFSPLEGLRPPAPPAEPTAAMGDLEIRELRPGVWLHVSRHEYPNGSTFPSNGLAVADGDDGLFLVDTAWGEVATVNLVRRLEEVTGRKVTRAVTTHFHYDRVAGADVLTEMGVETLAHPRTIPLANRLGGPTPRNAVEALAAPGGHATVGPVELFYPGAGHAEDNLVVWVPEAKVLFGGCAVREAATSSAGNTADADMESWPEAIRRVRARYPEAEVVVPGHGEPGGTELLDHTIEVLEANPA
jgi:metallo-beta-lactamase class B VIM